MKKIEIGDLIIYREIDILIFEVMNKDDFGNYYLICWDDYGPFGGWCWDTQEFYKIGTL
jgi:hypothetical protein